MNPVEHTDLAARREQLRLRSAQLREQIAAEAQVFRPGLRAVDRVRDGVQSVRRLRHNQAAVLLLGAALAGATLARPRAVVNLGLRVWSGWQLLQRLGPVARGLRRQLR